MIDTPAAYPLSWPASGWPRTPGHRRTRAPFGQQKERAGALRAIEPISMVGARGRLQAEVERLRATNPILSSNVELRLDGQPRAGRPEPPDPGVALYMQLRGRPVVFACDRWDKVAGNMAALAAHIEAMRGIARWGVGSVEQLFTGYTALPAPLVPDDWRSALQQPHDLAAAEEAYRRLMRAAHPDAGGSDAAAAALNAAIKAARRHFGGSGRG